MAKLHLYNYLLYTWFLQSGVESINYQGNIPPILPQPPVSIMFSFLNLFQVTFELAAYFSRVSSALTFLPTSVPLKEPKDALPSPYNVPFSST